MEFLEAHGARIPAIGFGSGSLHGDACVAALREALRAGYRHIDTASSYGNETEVGEVIRDSGLPRDNVFITTKVWPDRLSDDEMLASAEESLKKLGVDQVDLFMIHWPYPEVTVRDMIRALNRVKARGLTRHIGVSNFTAPLMDAAWAMTDAPLVANQCEYHPMMDQTPVLEACRKHGTALVAYMPLGRREVLQIPVLADIAQRLGKTRAQVALRWLIQQKGVAAIPKSTDPVRMRQNLEVFDFSLSSADMAAIQALARPEGRLIQFPRMRKPDGSWQEFRQFAPVWDTHTGKLLK